MVSRNDLWAVDELKLTTEKLLSEKLKACQYRLLNSTCFKLLKWFRLGFLFVARRSADSLSFCIPAFCAINTSFLKCCDHSWHHLLQCSVGCFL